jgi:ribosomal-protein-alanine N-acetyltransferase
MSILNETTIRDMTLSDLEGVIALERRIFPTPWTQEIFEYEMRRQERALYLVVEVQGEIIGYLGAQVLGDEIHLTNMAIEPGMRRRGIGTALMLECLCRGIEQDTRWMTLEVRENNLEARGFYGRFGFRDMGLRKNYYVDTGEDAVIMASRDLQGTYFQQILAGLEAELARKAG